MAAPIPHRRDPAFKATSKTLSPVCREILKHPRVTYEADRDAHTLVLALKDELLVHPQADGATLKALKQLGRPAGTLRGTAQGSGQDITIWRLNPGENSLAAARKVRKTEKVVLAHGAPAVELATVTPHHIAVVSAGGPIQHAKHYDTCPYGPPSPHAAVATHDWISPPGDYPRKRVVVIDTGYIKGNPALAARGHITSHKGLWLDSGAAPPAWVPSGADVPDANGDGLLDDIAGHGTFVTGLVAKNAPEADIDVVGLRHDVVPLLAGSRRLFTSELAVIAALTNALEADVISCGFAFPTLDGFPSLGTWAMLDKLPADRPAIVAPAGNEATSAPYWPAAHPRVIGVAATDAKGIKRAEFSNWGAWVDCCARGEDVVSTFVRWPTTAPTFKYWATWSGTCFATPKVAGAIARVASTKGCSPVDAFAMLLGGGVVPVGHITDRPDPTDPPHTVTHLKLG